MACRSCGLNNPAGSKFCNHCGSSLALGTTLLCPNCQTPNPSDLLYCDTCGTRLLEESLPVEEPERPDPALSRPQAFSLPSRPAGETADLNVASGIPDWLKTGDTPDLIHTEDEPEDVPAWLQDIEMVEEETPSLDDVSQGYSPEDDLPDWLTDGSEPQEIFAPKEKSTDELFEGFSESSKQGMGDEAWAQEDLPDWLADLAKPGTGPLPTLPVDDVTKESAPLPDWLDEIETVDMDDGSAPPDWLQGLEGVDEPLAELEPEPVDDGMDVPDWLTDLEAQQAQGADSFEADEATVVPDWLAEAGRAFDEGDIAPAGDDVPDWLTNLEEDEPIIIDETSTIISAGMPDKAEEPLDLDPPDLAVPDWLTDLENAPSAEETAAEQQDVPDWLSGLDEPVLPEDDGPEDLDWLSGLDDLSDEDVALLTKETASDWEADEGTGAEPLVESVDEPAMPDWLSDLESPADEVGGEADRPSWLDKSTPDTSIISGEQLPDWLGDLSVADEEPTEDVAEQPGWLAGLAGDSAPDAAGGSDSSGEALPDWLRDLSGADELLVGSEAEQPTWLAGLAEDSTPDVADEPDVMPDWLADLRGPLVTTDVDVDVDADADDVPDWLADAAVVGDVLDEAELDEAVAELPEPEGGDVDLLGDLDELAVTDAGDVPDWLQEMASSGDEGDDLAMLFPAGDDVPDWLAEDSSETTTVADDLPDWLTDIDEVDEGVAAVTGTTPADDLPDWLDDFGQADSDRGDDLPEDGSDGAIVSSEPIDDLPDWLDDVLPQVDAFDEFDFLDMDVEDEPSSPVSSELRGVPKQLVGDNLPSWLEDNPLEVEQPAEENAPDEIPDWLKPADDAAFTSTLFDVDLGEGEGLDDSGEWAELLGDLPDDEDEIIELSEGEIPEWLEALKPPELMAEGDPEPVRSMQTTGPLTGLRGVVEIEPIIARPDGKERPMPSYNVTKAQQRQVALLQQLTHEDRKPAVVVAQSGTQPMLAPVRLLLAVLVIAAMVAGWFFVDLVEVSPLPTRGVAEAQATMGQLGDAPVLFVVDYAPAVAGELNPQAVLLLSELEARGVAVVLASQSPAGLAIGEGLTAEHSAINQLGYIPGEASGLRQLSGCLQTVCDTLFNRPLDEELGAMLSEVGAIIVLTSEREALVNWIEQVERVYEGPVVVGVPQALSPVAVTYLNSGQLQGLLAGVSGVATYESAELADGWLSALAFGQWAVVLLFILGNVYYFIRTRRS